MGIISKTILITGTFALGYCIAGGCDSPKTQVKSNYIVTEPRPDTPVVGSGEVSIDYVTSKNFDGLLFTNAATGEKGFLMRDQWNGGKHWSYVNLEMELANPVKTVAVYQGRTAQTSAESSEGLLTRLLRKAENFVHEQIDETSN